MKQEQVKLVVVEPWNDVKLAERVAQEAGAKVRVLAPSVGALKEATSVPRHRRLQRAHAGRRAKIGRA